MTRRSKESRNKPYAARVSLVVAGCVICVGLGTAWVRYTRSPGYVADATIRCLARRDASGLVALASPAELKLFSLTAEGVAVVLGDTWWRDPRARPGVRFTKRIPRYVNLLTYEGTVTGLAPGGKPAPFEIEVYRDKSGRWRLGLGWLLQVTVLIRYPGQDHGDMLEPLLKRAGISGVTAPSGGGVHRADGSYGPDVNLPSR